MADGILEGTLAHNQRFRGQVYVEHYNIGEVFPDKAADTGVFGDGFVGAISILIVGDWTFYGYIINKWHSE
jgi:hypothetical protein